MKHIFMTKKNEQGFTLIELMIVVGIIGILVAIAAPNFARYQSKARQSEAKIGLAAIYGGEKSFYSEYSAYINSMDAIGYMPEGNKRYYTIGWSAVGATATGYAGVTTIASYARVNFPAGWTVCTPALVGAPATGADNQTFTAQASGQLRDGQNCDFWVIDQNKLVNNATIQL